MFERSRAPPSGDFYTLLPFQHCITAHMLHLDPAVVCPFQQAITRAIQAVIHNTATYLYLQHTAKMFGFATYIRIYIRCV